MLARRLAHRGIDLDACDRRALALRENEKPAVAEADLEHAQSAKRNVAKLGRKIAQLAIGRRERAVPFLPRGVIRVRIDLARGLVHAHASRGATKCFLRPRQQSW